MTILVVDDDTLVLGVFESMLRSRGHEVLAATDSATAMTLLAEHGQQPDVLLVDVALAGESGIDLAEDVRALYPDIGVVFTTGFAHREPTARRAGIGEVLRKPFRPQQLFDVISRAASKPALP
jgi:CheY-like chemotaxis protein